MIFPRKDLYKCETIQLFAKQLAKIAKENTRKYRRYPKARFRANFFRKAGGSLSKKLPVQTSVKDKRLIKIRRGQMVKAAITLFKEKGFHRTTTREIARYSGFSIGTLYEYIRAKEDILYLVCDEIYDEVQSKMQAVIAVEEETTAATLQAAITAYFQIMNDLQDEVLVMYQEAKSLPKEHLRYVLQKELQMVKIFESLIMNYLDDLNVVKPEQEITLHAHNLVVQGQMWAFRRWSLQKTYTLDEYIRLQIAHFFGAIHSGQKQ